MDLFTVSLSLALASASLNPDLARIGQESAQAPQKDVSREVNDPASVLRRLDMDFSVSDSKALGTITSFAPALTMPLDARTKIKFTIPFTGSVLTKGLELGDLSLGVTHIPYQDANRSLVTGLRVDFNTGSPTRGTGGGATALSPALGVVFNTMFPNALFVPLLQWKTSIGAPRDDRDVSLGTLKLIYVHLLPQGQWLRFQPNVNVDFESNRATTGSFLVQYGRMLSGNASLNIGYEANMYGKKPGNGSFQIGLGYLF